MRRASKVDKNQGAIVSALRKLGCSVELLHKQGQGCPDLLVGYRGKNYLIEVKDGSLAPSRRSLNDLQVEWHSNWLGQVCIIESIDEAIKFIKDF